MKSGIVAIAALYWCTISDVAVTGETGMPISIGERFTIESTVLNDTRAYLFNKPKGYDFTKDAYPVLVVLDGGDLFQHVSVSMDFLAESGRIPQLIVVGIPNTNRGRDYESADGRSRL